MVTLKLESKTGTRKRSIDTKYPIKASIEAPNRFRQEELKTRLNDSESFISDLNSELQSNGQLSMVQAISISEPVVVGEHLGTSIFTFMYHINRFLIAFSMKK